MSKSPVSAAAAERAHEARVADARRTYEHALEHARVAAAKRASYERACEALAARKRALDEQCARARAPLVAALAAAETRERAARNYARMRAEPAKMGAQLENGLSLEAARLAADGRSVERAAAERARAAARLDSFAARREARLVSIGERGVMIERELGVALEEAADAAVALDEARTEYVTLGALDVGDLIDAEHAHVPSLAEQYASATAARDVAAEHDARLVERDADSAAAADDARAALDARKAELSAALGAAGKRRRGTPPKRAAKKQRGSDDDDDDDGDDAAALRTLVAELRRERDEALDRARALGYELETGKAERERLVGVVVDLGASFSALRARVEGAAAAAAPAAVSAADVAEIDRELAAHDADADFALAKRTLLDGADDDDDVEVVRGALFAAAADDDEQPPSVLGGGGGGAADKRVLCDACGTRMSRKSVQRHRRKCAAFQAASARPRGHAAVAADADGEVPPALC